MPLGAARLSLLAYQAAVAAAGRTAITLTAQQQVQVSTAQSKFGGASAYFDGGTDDYILVDHTGFSHAYSDNFTYECWFRLDSLPSLFTMLATGSTRGDYLSIYNKSGTWTVTAPVSNGSSVYTQIRNIGFTPSINTWYHVALVKDGTSLKMFFDGTELTVNNGSAGTMSADKGWNGVSRIGDWAGGSNYATTGYIDEVRWSSTARYSSSFTPPTSAFTNDTDTLLLVHMDGVNGSTTFTDDTVTPAAASRTPFIITTFGNAQVDTVQSNFGGASALFDGNGDYLSIPDSNDWELGTNITNWTIEFWLRLPSLPNAYKGIISHQMPGSGSNTGWGAYISNTNKLTFAGSTSSFASGATTLSANTWQHCAIVREGSTLKYYVNGALDYTNTNYTNKTDSSGVPLIIGFSYNVSSGYNGQLYLNGYLDEIRISNTARYTSAFAPPTSAFTNDANTLLLVHADGADGSTAFSDDGGA